MITAKTEIFYLHMPKIASQGRTARPKPTDGEMALNAYEIIKSCERVNDEVFYMHDINGGVLVFAHTYDKNQLDAVAILCAMRKLDTVWQTSGALKINLQKCSIIINKA